MGGSMGSGMPLRPLHYASYSSDMAQAGTGAPYVVQGGGYYQMNQLPTSPPRGGPPAPLVFETHRSTASYGGAVIPGIPAHVYQIPKFPDMSQGAYHNHNPSDDRSHPY